MIEGTDPMQIVVEIIPKSESNLGLNPSISRNNIDPKTFIRPP